MRLNPGKLYEVVPAESNPLLATFGRAAVAIEMACFGLMKQQLGEHYKGGQWEFRRYINGALMMVLADDTLVTAVSGNQREVTCSIEVISTVSWMMALSHLNMVAYQRDDDKLSELCHDHYHACREMVCGQMRFVIDTSAEQGYREPNEEEMRIFQSTGEGERPHPHAEAIMELLD